MQNAATTPNETRAALARANRSAATQAAVDRYAADPAAKNTRSLALARAHGLTTARLTSITRAIDADATILSAQYSVPSQSQPASAPHTVSYDAASDTVACDCPAGINGLPCGHAGAALTAGRKLLAGDAILRTQRAAIQREAAAWHAALDAMQAHEEARRTTCQAREEAAILYRNPRPFSLWKSEL